MYEGLLINDIDKSSSTFRARLNSYAKVLDTDKPLATAGEAMFPIIKSMATFHALLNKQKV